MITLWLHSIQPTPQIDLQINRIDRIDRIDRIRAAEEEEPPERKKEEMLVSKEKKKFKKFFPSFIRIASNSKEIYIFSLSSMVL
jgi:hypothetical protein